MNDDTQEDKEQRITVRFPASVLERMRLMARRNQRSLNGEIVWAVRHYLMVWSDDDPLTGEAGKKIRGKRKQPRKQTSNEEETDGNQDAADAKAN